MSLCTSVAHSSRVRRRAATDQGSATVEFAVALPAVVMLVAVLAALVAAASAQIHVIDAASVAVRTAIVGSARGDVIAAAQRVAGPDAHVAIAESDGWVTVSVERPVVSALGAWRASAVAEAPLEGG